MCILIAHLCCYVSNKHSGNFKYRKRKKQRNELNVQVYYSSIMIQSICESTLEPAFTDHPSEVIKWSFTAGSL